MKTQRGCTNKYLLVAALLLAGLVPIADAGALDEEAVLNTFRDSYAWLSSAAMHISNEGESIKQESEDGKGDEQTLRHYSDVKFFIDDVKGWHASQDSRSIDVATGKVARYEGGSLQQFSWDNGIFKEAGNWAVQYRYDVVGGHYVTLDTKLDGNAAVQASFGRTAVVTGHSLSFSHLRIPELLESYPFQVSDGELDGVASCIVESDTEYGQMKLWLSPTENYSLQKAVFIKEYGKSLSWRGDKVYGKDYQGTVNVQELRVLKKEARGAFFIPVEVEELTYDDIGDEKRNVWKSLTTVSNVVLNPDFAAMKGFVLQVPQDSTISIRNHSENRTDTLLPTTSWKASWKEGKPAFHLEDEDLQTRGQLFLSTIEIKKTPFVDKALRWMNKKLKKTGTGMGNIKNRFIRFFRS